MYEMREVIAERTIVVIDDAMLFVALSIAFLHNSRTTAQITVAIVNFAQSRKKLTL